MADEPDLDEPGRPLIARLQHEDGSWSPLEIDQTKRNNYQDLATACGGCENVTREACEAAGLDWREWGYFVVEMLEHQKETEEWKLAYETYYEAMHGEKLRGLPPMRKDRLGLLHLKEELGPANDDEKNGEAE